MFAFVKRLNYLSLREGENYVFQSIRLDKAVAKVQTLTAARKSRFNSNSLNN